MSSTELQRITAYLEEQAIAIKLLQSQINQPKLCTGCNCRVIPAPPPPIPVQLYQVIVCGPSEWRYSVLMSSELDWLPFNLHRYHFYECDTLCDRFAQKILRNPHRVIVYMDKSPVEIMLIKQLQYTGAVTVIV